jgi:hypothetical protein
MKTTSSICSSLKLGKYDQYEVKDERALFRGIDPGHDIVMDERAWQKYLDETAGDVIVMVTVPERRLSGERGDARRRQRRRGGGMECRVS